MEVSQEMSKDRAIALNLINKLLPSEGERIYNVQVMYVTEKRAKELIEYAKRVLGVKDITRRDYTNEKDSRHKFHTYDIGPMCLFVREDDE
jgi:hypothetical protein